MKIFDDSLKINKCEGIISRNPKGWSEGDVLTPNGIVSVYAQGDSECDHLTRLRFIRNGRIYFRTFIGKKYSNKGIVTKAKQFVDEIINL